MSSARALLRPRLLWGGLACLALAAHLALVANFVRPADLAGEEPFYRIDYAAIYAYGLEARHYLARLALSGYNPYQLAGFPSYGWPSNNWLPVFMELLWFVHPARVFKGLVLATFLLAPLWPAWGARRRGEAAALAALVLVLSVAYWQLDRFTYLFRWYGGVSFLFASFLAPLTLASCIQFLEAPSARPALRAGLSLALLLSVHATALVAVACGIAGALVVRLRSLRASDYPLGLLVGLIAIAPNLVWLVPNLRLGRYHDFLPLFGQTGEVGAVRDLWLTPERSVLTLLLALAIPGLLLAWREASRVATAADLGALGGTLAIALVGTQLGLGELEPFRLVLTLGALALLPAARALEGLRRGALRRAWLLPVAALVALPFAVVPGYHALPKDLLLGYLNTEERPAAHGLRDWILAHTDTSARIAYEEGPPGHTTYFSCHFVYLLQQWTGREFLNGPYTYYRMIHRRVQFSDGSLAGVDVHSASPEALREVLDRYNVGWIVTSSAATQQRLELLPAIATRAATIDGFGIFTVRGQSRSFFAEGDGRVEADYDVIRVSAATAGSVVLKYHWYEGLRSVPELPIRREPVAGDPVGFLRIDNGSTRDFELRNTR